MSHKYFYNSRIARSIIYLLTVGGLFASISISFYFLWNYVLSNIFYSKHFNMLESLGIASILYILYFGIKFGIKNETAETSASKMTKLHDSDNQTVLFSKKIFNNLTEKERLELIRSVTKTIEHTQFSNQKFN
ncbi:MAG: hypothetical protein NT007_16160 [Candidatus Kapabacteria bacterium]|nr:hypothetical protein [Candidatus Kapabacteria bacterium]